MEQKFVEAKYDPLNMSNPFRCIQHQAQTSSKLIVETAPVVAGLLYALSHTAPGTAVAGPLVAGKYVQRPFVMCCIVKCCAGVGGGLSLQSVVLVCVGKSFALLTENSPDSTFHSRYQTHGNIQIQQNNLCCCCPM